LLSFFATIPYLVKIPGTSVGVPYIFAIFGLNRINIFFVFIFLILLDVLEQNIEPIKYIIWLSGVAAFNFRNYLHEALVFLISLFLTIYAIQYTFSFDVNFAYLKDDEEIGWLPIFLVINSFKDGSVYDFTMLNSDPNIGCLFLLIFWITSSKNKNILLILCILASIAAGARFVLLYIILYQIFRWFTGSKRSIIGDIIFGLVTLGMLIIPILIELKINIRIIIWLNYMTEISKSPLAIIGVPHKDILLDIMNHAPHNTFIDMYLDYGLVGLAFMVIFIIKLSKKVYDYNTKLPIAGIAVISTLFFPFSLMHSSLFGYLLMFGFGKYR